MKKIKIALVVSVILMIAYIAGNIFGFGMMMPKVSNEELEYIQKFQKKHPSISVGYSPPEGGNETTYQIINITFEKKHSKFYLQKSKNICDDFFKEFVSVYSYKNLVDSVKIKFREFGGSELTYNYKVDK